MFKRLGMFDRSLGMFQPLGKFAAVFTPAELFASGEQGTWYDPSDFSSMYQDSAGTMPVTAVEQPVGLMLDKSQGLALGNDIVVNGGFATDTAWTKGIGWTISSGVATELGNQFTQLSQILTTVSGVTYKLTFTATVVSGTFGVYARQNTTSGTTLASKTDITAAGSYQIIFTATSTATAIFFAQLNLSAVSTITIDNVYANSIAGNHASQSTSAARPILSARVNLLTYTEQFDNAAWVRTGLNAFGSGSVANTTATTDPISGNTADFIQENTVSTFHLVNSLAASFIATLGVRYTFSCYFKAASGIRIVQLFGKYAVAGTGGGKYDLQNGTALYASGSGSGEVAISSVGNGWYKCAYTFTAIASGGAELYICLAQNTSQNFLVSYTGDGTSGVYMWGADLRVANDGVGLPDYQRVAAATDYDTVGFPPYLYFDGVDDFLVTGNINFSATDKMSVFAGVRKLSDAANGMVFETSTAWNINPGSFSMQIAASSSNDYSVTTNATYTSSGTRTGYSLTSYVSPITNVAVVNMDMSKTARADVLKPRINGIIPTLTGTLDATITPANYGTYPLYIGRRGGTTLPFTGRIYSLITRGALTSSPQLEQTEQWVATKTGVTL